MMAAAWYLFLLGLTVVLWVLFEWRIRYTRTLVKNLDAHVLNLIDKIDAESLARFRSHLATIESERAAHQREMLEADFARAKDPFHIDPTPGAEGGER